MLANNAIGGRSVHGSLLGKLDGGRHGEREVDEARKRMGVQSVRRLRGVAWR